MDKPLIGIIGGKGKMGQYFADFFVKAGFEVLVSDAGTKTTNKELAKKADVVIVSVPMDKTEAVIAEVAPLLKPSQLFMDLTSLKEGPVRAMLKSKASVIGTHPLFGPTHDIAGQVIVVSLARPGKWGKWLTGLLEKNHVIVRPMKPEEHDSMMAYVQVLSHFSDLVLADTLRASKIPIETFMKYQSPVYKLKLDMMGRLLHQDPKLYANIQLKNPHARRVIRDFLERSLEWFNTVKTGDSAKFEGLFKEASRYLGDFAEGAFRESNRVLHLMKGESPMRFEDRDEKYEVAILGPSGSYSEAALSEVRPGVKPLYLPTIASVFEAVEKGKVKSGLVPLENSSSGSVRETLDELYARKVSIHASHAHTVDLVLAGSKKGQLKALKRVYSHPQALLQCREFIKKHLSKAQMIPMPSTAAAVEFVGRTRDPEEGAIASLHAANLWDLEVLASGLQGKEDNVTTFVWITKAAPSAQKGDKRLLVCFTFSKDKPGSLVHALQIFKDHAVNLTRIESRPNPKVSGDHVFYVEMEGGLHDKNAQAALKGLKVTVKELRILGSYS
jgi:prephenate dehydratase/prephenate dehydrogenase